MKSKIIYSLLCLVILTACATPPASPTATNVPSWTPTSPPTETVSPMVANTPQSTSTAAPTEADAGEDEYAGIAESIIVAAKEEYEAAFVNLGGVEGVAT